MDHNPWADISVDAYNAHMGHPEVGQSAVLSEMTGEQLRAAAAMIDNPRVIAILGVTDGNGVEHAADIQFEKLIGVDVNDDFLHACRAKFPSQGGRYAFRNVDLVSDKARAVAALGEANIFILNLVIEHIGLSVTTDLFSSLPQKKRFVSCVIQENRDGSVASKSGHEHAFSEIVPLVREVSPVSLIEAMEGIGYALVNTCDRTLANGKIFLRYDFCDRSLRSENAGD